MKKFIKIISRWKYSWPAWLFTVIWIWTYAEKTMAPNGWGLFASIIVGSLLLAAEKWWGCFIGSIFGVYGIAEHYYKIKNHELIFIDTRYLSLIVIAYYLWMGYLVYKNRKCNSEIEK